MKRRFMSLLAVASILLVFPAYHFLMGGPPIKVAVCHVPPGSAGNGHVIFVGQKGDAVESHLAHGDCLSPVEILGEPCGCN